MNEIKKPPTAPPPGLIANPTNDITIPLYSRVLRPQDETLLHRGGGKGIALYREVLKDGRAYSVLQKRKRKLISREWTIEPASEARIDKKAAKLVEAQLRNLNMQRIALELLDATLMGFAVGEVVWDKTSDGIVASNIVKHDQRRFVFDADRNPKLLTWDNLAWGIDLPERKFIVHRFEDLSSDPYGWGLGRVLFWHVLFKREGVAFWMKALERFATPLPVAKYPIGTLPAQQDELMRAIAGALVDGALVVPTGTEISFATAAVSGTLTHEDWCRYWDEQTAETVLGQNLSTNVSGGSKAAASTHVGIEDEMIDGDGNMLAATLRETLFGWITAYNASDGQPPNLVFKRPANEQAEETAKAARAARRAADLANVASLRKLGYVPSDEQAELEQIMETDLTPALANDPAPDLTPPADAPPGDDTGDDTTEFASSADGDLDQDIDTLETHVQPEFEKWLGVIRGVIDDLLSKGGELRDLPNALLKIYPNLSTAKIAALLGAALTNSDLRGRADVVDQAK